MTHPIFKNLPWICSLALFLANANLNAADAFPPIEQLPSHPETPDPLVMLDGTRVTNRTQWVEQRRPELKALYQHYMYGAMPPAPDYLHFEVERVDTNFFGGKATKKEVAIRFSEETNAPVIHLLVIVPNAKKQKMQPSGNGAARLMKKDWKSDARRFPVFVSINTFGNDTVVADTNIALPESWIPTNRPGSVDHHATDKARGYEVNVWNVEQSIDRGYGFATFYSGDIQPDITNSPTGLRAWLTTRSLAVSNAQPVNLCGAIEAWAWGLSRAVDYLVTDKSIDARRIAVVGHSRFGKACIVAAAFDERFAMAVPLQSGTGGTAPNRGKIGESVKAINNRFPHWFNDQFKKFNEHTDQLPFDQDDLIALVAPRPVLIGAATGDTWTNPMGTFEMLRAVDPVYRLLGKHGLETAKVPPLDHLVGQHAGYFIRAGKHSMTKSDWQKFLDFADREMP